jgi:SAM-dependent methyltransferase
VNETQEHWDHHYGQRERVWSGRVNQRLAEIAAPLPPGRALDLGCGEGGDAVWLAERGWHVVAVDVSEVALQRATAEARARGVADRIDFVHHDLSATFPAGVFDLVSAQFLHSTIELDRPRILQRAAAAVAGGGVLAVVDHGSAPPTANEEAHRHHEFPSTQEVLDGLDLPAADWEPACVGAADRHGARPDGTEGTWVDNVIVLRRRV